MKDGCKIEKIFSLYSAVNTLCLFYKNQSINQEKMIKASAPHILHYILN